jgi:hypothetical protein
MKNTEQTFSRGDRVYYLYTKPDGTQVKFVAVVIECQPDGVMIRVGRYDVHSKEISTFESTVDETSLQARTVPCSYEDELRDRE